MQIIDEESNSDAVLSESHVTGSVYDILPPEFLLSRQVGEFNHSRMVVSGRKIEHWLNGIKVLDYSLGDSTWSRGVENSLFKEETSFGDSATGHIAVVNQQGKLSLKNIRLRNL